MAAVHRDVAMRRNLGEIAWLSLHLHRVSAERGNHPVPLSFIVTKYDSVPPDWVSASVERGQVVEMELIALPPNHMGSGIWAKA
jgi:hypothetical protein